MFCNECGQKNQDNAKFCSACGSKLNIVINDEKKEEKLTEVIKQQQEVNKKPEEKKFQQTKKNDIENKVIEETSERKTISIEERLTNLSTAGMVRKNRTASTEIDPIKDPYWDDILPEINNEIYAIPKDNIIKLLASVVALFLVICYLIYMI